MSQHLVPVKNVLINIILEILHYTDPSAIFVQFLIITKDHIYISLWSYYLEGDDRKVWLTLCVYCIMYSKRFYLKKRYL